MTGKQKEAINKLKEKVDQYDKDSNNNEAESQTG